MTVQGQRVQPLICTSYLQVTWPMLYLPSETMSNVAGIAPHLSRAMNPARLHKAPKGSNEIQDPPSPAKETCLQYKLEKNILEIHSPNSPGKFQEFQVFHVIYHSAFQAAKWDHPQHPENLKLLALHSSPSFWDLRLFADICGSFSEIGEIFKQ